MRHLHRTLCIISLLALLCASSGLSAERAESPQTPFLLHLPGIGGHMRIDDLVTSGMRQGGLDADIRIYDWTEGNPGMAALAGYDRNHIEAQKIADLITREVHAHPHRRIIVTSHSGGGALAVWALEKLPDDVHIDTLLFLAPALSPTYDLSAALKHVSGKAYAFSSTYDPILSYGTRGFGTMDRVKCDAAGYCGFSEPEHPADASQYKKLVSIPYQDTWTRFGNAGDHIGAMMRPFARNILAPLLISGRVPAVVATTQPASRPAAAATP